ncbi:hypothetical protein GQ457_07G029780 [Hibiscus cannabinus]
MNYKDLYNADFFESSMAIKIIQNVTYESTTFLTDMLPPHSSKGRNKLQMLDFWERNRSEKMQEKMKTLKQTMKAYFSSIRIKVVFSFMLARFAGNILIPVHCKLQCWSSNSIVLAAAVLVALQFLLPLFYCTPNIILAAIIIIAVMGLIDYQAAYKLWKVDKLDFLAFISSFFGVRFIHVPLGLAIAISLLNFSKLELSNLRDAQLNKTFWRYTFYFLRTYLINIYPPFKWRIGLEIHLRKTNIRREFDSTKQNTSTTVIIKDVPRKYPSWLPQCRMVCRKFKRELSRVLISICRLSPV